MSYLMPPNICKSGDLDAHTDNCDRKHALTLTNSGGEIYNSYFICVCYDSHPNLGYSAI